ncbi:4Fe-4S dicluster domain-containing protein [Aliiglaciecola litoralis]|uniref:4Fe-4S ferredoxin-type domain-containing protein n=1 Tax=Aliiglaciecola litoralis TaxID=582857 RepID=A0ABN1LRA7_9ALTE
MNEQRFILDNIMSLKRHLLKRFDVYQITADRQGEKSWQVSEADEVLPLFGPKNLPLVSLKRFFFAENEAIYSFNGNTFSPIKPKIEPRAIFGVQACDLTAISYQDTFFKDDPYYQARRQQTLLVGIDCNSPCEKGFCHEMNAGPHVDSAHADLILSQFSDLQNTAVSSTETAKGAWLLIAATEKGRDSLQGLVLQNAPENWPELRQQLKQQVVAKFADFSYIKSSTEIINKGQVPAKLWEELSVRCLACSGCTNLCPTCSCYSSYEQYDSESNQTTTRRIWDSCQFEGFQREASNHNPSQLAAQRTERFWFHKFSNAYLPEFGRYGCVGCGRCEQTCAGSIGVHSVMKRINQVCCN